MLNKNTLCIGYYSITIVFFILFFLWLSYLDLSYTLQGQLSSLTLGYLYSQNNYNLYGFIDFTCVIKSSLKNCIDFI